MTSVFCLHEDRADHGVGLQLAIESLALHAPGRRVLVHCPALEGSLGAWIEGRPDAALIRLADLETTGWNVKPSLLQRLLEDHEDVTWIDSDILLTGPVDHLFAAMSPDTFVATEETRWGQRQGGDIRTRAWGLAPARVFRTTVNSGIVRVTRRHLRLLQAWRTMLAHPTYRRAQAMPWYERPIHMVGDQEVLTALLGATEFADVPVRLLKRGRDIAQCFGPAGFTPIERLRTLASGLPPLVHAMGPKPWVRTASNPQPSGFLETAAASYRSLAAEVSPYTLAAARYRPLDATDLGWTTPRTFAGRALVTLGAGSPTLSGFPLAVFDHAARAARRALGVGRYEDRADFLVREHPFGSGVH